MKTKLFALASVCAVGFGHSQVWTTQIRQLVGGSNGVEMSSTTDPDGKGSLVSLPIPAQGVTYQLVVLADNVAKTVQNKSVGAYSLSAKVVLGTKDSTFSKSDSNGTTTLARTRIDWPFSVTYTVGGLQVGVAGVEVAGTKLSCTHETRTFPAGALVGADGLAWTTKSTTDLTTNGQYSPIQFLVSNIYAGNLTAAGEECFSIRSLEGFQNPASDLAISKLQVWPVASATLSGISSGQTYQALPDVTVTMQNLYPDSNTWVAVYRGAPGDASTVLTNGNYTLVPRASLLINDQSITATPVSSSTIQISGAGVNGLGSIVNQSGQWTIMVVHEIFPAQSPQAAGRPQAIREISTTVPFFFDPTIRVNGQVFSSE